MFGIGMPEMILILAVALIVIGPKKLPDLAKSLGKAMGEFKKATSDLKESMQIDTGLGDVKSTFEDLGKDQPEASPADENAVDEAAAEDLAAPAAEAAKNLKSAFNRDEDADTAKKDGDPLTEGGAPAQPDADKG